MYIVEQLNGSHEKCTTLDGGSLNSVCQTSWLSMAIKSEIVSRLQRRVVSSPALCQRLTSELRSCYHPLWEDAHPSFFAHLYHFTSKWGYFKASRRSCKLQILWHNGWRCFSTPQYLNILAIGYWRYCDELPINKVSVPMYCSPQMIVDVCLKQSACCGMRQVHSCQWRWCGVWSRASIKRRFAKISQSGKKGLY